MRSSMDSHYNHDTAPLSHHNPLSRKRRIKVSFWIGCLLLVVDLVQIVCNQAIVTQEALVFSTVRKTMTMDETTTTRQAIDVETTTTSTVSSNNNMTRILLFAFVFDEETRQSHRLLDELVESVRRSDGVDLILVGPSLTMEHVPSNVRHFNITWDGMMSRLHETVVVEGKDRIPMYRRSGDHPSKRYHKDWKLLFGHIFSELTLEYDWWGNVDHHHPVFFPHHFWRTLQTDPMIWRQDRDILSIATTTTNGCRTCSSDDDVPLILYKNTAAVHAMFRSSIDSFTTTLYGERWRYDVSGQRLVDPRRYHVSIKEIMEQQAKSLGLRRHRANRER